MKKFIDAFRGVLFAIKDGTSLKIQLVFSVVSLGLGFYFNISISEWCFILLAIGLVIAAEIFNTSIEWVCNFMEPKHNEEIGKIKDTAAGAVLVLAVTAFVVGLIIFTPKIIALW
jgi:diacylglycerol kinase (ATP)